VTQSPELAIRMMRAAFNRALEVADLDAIGACLAPSALLVAGTDSAVIAGRKAQLQAWRREFAVIDRAIYVRNPESVVLSPVLPLAFEHGSWSGVSSTDRSPLASGTYTAKWRQIGAEWLIEVELYLTLA
jgi:ketosteroid isomerase-like protein